MKTSRKVDQLLMHDDQYQEWREATDRAQGIAFGVCLGLGLWAVAAFGLWLVLR